MNGIFGTLILLEIAAANGLAQERVAAGAIRWDAWHGARSEVGKAVERSLGPEKWHGRVPFFGRIVGEDRVEIDDANQGAIDREIGYARRARLDYWAFLLYEDGSAMNLGLQHYLASGRKKGLRFCVIVEMARWRTEFARVAELTARAEYQRVAGGRPLIYVLDNGAGAVPEMALDRLRAAVREKSGGDPYVVIQDYRPARANGVRVKLGADAIGAYAYQREGRNAPYAQLAAETAGFWEECRGTGSAVVPIVMTGWDRRPRVERPVFWETWQKAGVGIDRYYAAPTEAELSRHVAEAVGWVREHGEAAPAKAILIYAWNENDEGGWLEPTVGDGVRRLEAVRKGLGAPALQSR